jgi:lipoprotein NlpI
MLALLEGSEPGSALGKPGGSDVSQKCYKATRAEQAINDCSQAIQSGRLSGKALAFVFYRRGNAYNEKRDHDRAIHDYNEAIRLNPLHANSFSNRGVAYARKRDYDHAIQDYDEAIRLNPGHADAFSNRGVAYARKGDYDRAILNYDQAIRLNPDHASAFYDRGNAYRRKGDYDQAVQNYDQAIRLNPGRASAYSNRGIAYASKGDDDRAIQDYDEAIRLDPKHINAHYNRGNAYRRKRDYAAAVQDYDRVTRLDPNHGNAYSSRGLVRFYQGQFAAAVPDFFKATEFTPGNLYPILLLYLSQARAGEQAQGGLAEATAGLELEEWPGLIVSMYLDKLPEHVVLDSVAGANETRRCQAYFYLGQHFLMRQNNSEAAGMFRKAVATNASNLFEHEAAQAELNRLGN